MTINILCGDPVPLLLCGAVHKVRGQLVTLLIRALVAVQVADHDPAQQTAPELFVLAARNHFPLGPEVAGQRVRVQLAPVHVPQQVAVSDPPELVLPPDPGEELPLVPGQTIRLRPVVLHGLVLGERDRLRLDVQRVGLVL